MDGYNTLNQGCHNAINKAVMADGASPSPGVAETLFQEIADQVRNDFSIVCNDSLIVRNDILNKAVKASEDFKSAVHVIPREG